MNINNFLLLFRESIENDTFVRLTLSSPLQKSEGFTKIIVKLVLLKNIQMLNMIFRLPSRDITKNLAPDEGIQTITEHLNNDFSVATLFTINQDIVFEKHKKSARIRYQPPSFQSLPDRTHDKQKKRLIQPGSKKYLYYLGLADDRGNIFPSAQDKYKQINKYIELLSSHLASFATKKKVTVADMGSGKGYLTFALYDHLTNNLNTAAEITGIEIRKELVDLCNEIAKQEAMHGLKFVENTIQQADVHGIDMLVALHACDTATDDALHKGISAGARLIVVAPCCHKQIRREMETHKVKTDIDFITHHGIFLERQAEMITDAMRVLILEYFGYRIKVAEFIADAHTHKNVMIIAEKFKNSKEIQTVILENIKQIRQKFGISYHALEKLTGII